MTGFEILCGVVAVLFLFYYYLTSTYNFWKKRGVPGPKPIPLFGNIASVMFSRLSMAQYMREVYKKYKSEPVLGLFIRRQPLLVINDTELIKRVLIKDFTKFSDRGLSFAETAEPLSKHLFFLETKRWRSLRTRLTPVFTSGKLKEMFFMIVDCANNLEKRLETLAVKGDPIDCQELTNRYTVDVIGTCAFGINMNYVSDVETTFRKIGKEFFTVSLAQQLRVSAKNIAPKLYNLLSSILPRPFGTDFFIKSVLTMIQHRKKNNIVRNDFIDTLMDIQAHPEKLENIDVTDSLLAAQAFVFFLAGFETSSTAISNALYELALNQDIQNKLREEINEHNELNNGEWHYENIKAMPILDGVFKETLRIYPSVPFIDRRSVDNYTFEDFKFSIPKDIYVSIPMYGIHNDPDIYPNPDVFDISRFTPEAESKRNPMHYLPFGDGPRNCIGTRFAVFEVKLALIKTIRNYKFDVCEKTTIPYKVDPRALLLAPNHPIILKVTKVER
nr:probable cytochrome P450 6a14 [Megalopta genalis]